MFNWFRRRKVKVEIQCLHGRFLPSAFRPWQKHSSAFGCKKCGFRVVLSTYTERLDW